VGSTGGREQDARTSGDGDAQHEESRTRERIPGDGEHIGHRGYPEQSRDSCGEHRNPQEARPYASVDLRLVGGGAAIPFRVRANRTCIR
jgi:hypothetical protein